MGQIPDLVLEHSFYFELFKIIKKKTFCSLEAV